VAEAAREGMSLGMAGRTCIVEGLWIEREGGGYIVGR